MLRTLQALTRGKGLRSQLVRGGLGVGMLQFVSLSLMLLATILLARGLGPEGFGQYAFVVALITTLSIPFGPALVQLATRETAAMHQAGEVERIGMFVRWANRHVWIGCALIVAVVGSIALWTASWRVDDRWTLLLAGLAVLPLLGLNAVRSGVLAGLRRVVLGQFPELLVRPLVVTLGAGILLSIGFLNPLAAVAAFVVGVAFGLIVGHFLLRYFLPTGGVVSNPLGAEDQGRWARSWIPFTLLVGASTLNAQIGVLLLGWLSSASQVAVIQVAERGALLVNLSLSLVNIVISPHITRAFSQADDRALQKLSRNSARFALLAALPLALLLLAFGDPIISALFGAEYAEAAVWPLRILVLAQLINVAFGSLGMFLSMTSFERDTFRGNAVALLTNGILCLILIPSYEALGASIAAAGALVVWNLFLAVQVYRRLGIRPGVM